MIPELNPSPGITPTALPDPAPLLEESARWLPVDGPAEIVLLPGGSYRAALVAPVAGRPHAVLLLDEVGWHLNLPILADAPEGGAADTARRDLALAGYGLETSLAAGGSSSEIVGVRSAGGALCETWLGESFELPAGSEPVEIRWEGRAWVPGYGAGADWRPVLLPLINGGVDLPPGLLVLSFDDCHHYDDLAWTLDYLAGLGVCGTFYPNTTNVADFADLFRIALEAGHEIGFHTTLHLHGDWSPAYLDEDLAYFEDTVRAAAGYPAYRVTTVRPPFGLWDYGNWLPWAKSRGLSTFMWDLALDDQVYTGRIDRILSERQSMVLLAHPRPADRLWLNAQQDYMRDLVQRTHPVTATGALFEGGKLLPIRGLLARYQPAAGSI